MTAWGSCPCWVQRYGCLQAITAQKLQRLISSSTWHPSPAGYVIVSMMLRFVQNLPVRRAVADFVKLRPPGIYKEDYLQSLFDYYHEHRCSDVHPFTSHPVRLQLNRMVMAPHSSKLLPWRRSLDATPVPAQPPWKDEEEDPPQPEEEEGAYLILSLSQLIPSWSHWWLDVPWHGCWQADCHSAQESHLQQS